MKLIVCGSYEAGEEHKTVNLGGMTISHENSQVVIDLDAPGAEVTFFTPENIGALKAELDVLKSDIQNLERIASDTAKRATDAEAEVATLEACNAGLLDNVKDRDNRIETLEKELKAKPVVDSDHKKKDNSHR